MSFSLQLRDVSVSVNSPIVGGLVVSGLSITNKINAPPTIRVTGHLREFANRQSAELELSKQAATISSAQDEFFAPRERPESRISVRVGGESVTMACYLSRMSYIQSHGGGGGVGVSLVFIHPSVVLNSLNLGIYTASQIHAQGTVPNETSEQRAKYNQSLVDIGGSLADRMAEMVKRLTGSPRWPGLGKSTQAVKMRIHEVNKPFSNYLRNVLQASDGFDGWELENIGRNFSTGLNRWLLDTQLLYPTNFFNVLRQSLNQEMLLFMAVKLDDAIPRMASLSQMTATNPLEIRLPLQSFAPQTGASAMVPTTNTLIMGNAGYAFPHTGPGDRQWQPLRLFPPQSIVGGHFHQVNAPGWLHYTSGRGEGSSLPYLRPPRGAFDLLMLRRRSVDFMKHLIGEFTDATINRVYDRWVRIHHYHQLYGQSTASVVTDVRFNMQPGLCYKVSSLREDSMFVGFLQSATHSVNISQQGGNASTKLEFSHIRADVDKPGSGVGPMNSASDAENGLPASGRSF